MNSEAVQEYMIQANALMGQEKYEKALDYLKKAEAVDRFNEEVYVRKGIAYANLEEYEEAKKEFEKALKVNKKDGVVYFHLGNIEMLMGNKNKGLELYNNAIAYGFDNPQVYFSLGLMYEEEGEAELAIRNYSKAIIRDPNRADIRIRKIRLYISGGKMQEALQGLNELILSNPDVFEGYHLKYLVLANMEKFAEAEKVLNEASELFPKDPAFAIDKASLMITRKEYVPAVQMLDGLAEKYELTLDDRHSVAMEKARAYAFLEDMDHTIENLNLARKIAKEYDPPRMDLEAVYLLMNCYLNNEDYEKVIECAKEIKKAKEEGYYSLAAYFYEPFALKKQGKEDEASKLFKEAVEIYRNITLKSPGNVDSYAFRIMALREIENLDKALELADYLVDVRDDLAEAHTLRATVLEDMGRNQEAKKDRERAVELGGMLSSLPANNQ